jgi:hypothetical protein
MTIKFQTNVPVELRLRFLEGKPVESQFGGMQHMFTAEEGAFYVSETVGQILTEQFRKLGVRQGEPVDITKAEVAKGGGRKGIQWMVSKVGFAPGEQRDGTLAVPSPQPPSELEQKLAQSIALVEARKQAQQAQSAAPAAIPVWADSLVAQSNALIDAYSQVLKHAARYENVRGEDVRSIFLSTFINVTKNGGRSAA